MRTNTPRLRTSTHCLPDHTYNTTTAYSLRGRRSGLAVTFKGDTKAVIRCSKTTLKLEMSGTPRPRFITVYDTHSGPCKAHVVSDLTCSFMEVANGLIELLKVRSTLTLTLTLSHSHLVLCEGRAYLSTSLAAHSGAFLLRGVCKVGWAVFVRPPAVPLQRLPGGHHQRKGADTTH